MKKSKTNFVLTIAMLLLSTTGLAQESTDIPNRDTLCKLYDNAKSVVLAESKVTDEAVSLLEIINDVKVPESLVNKAKVVHARNKKLNPNNDARTQHYFRVRFYRDNKEKLIEFTRRLKSKIQSSIQGENEVEVKSLRLIVSFNDPDGTGPTFKLISDVHIKDQKGRLLNDVEIDHFVNSKRSSDITSYQIKKDISILSLHNNDVVSEIGCSQEKDLSFETAQANLERFSYEEAIELEQTTTIKLNSLSL